VASAWRPPDVHNVHAGGRRWASRGERVEEVDRHPALKSGQRRAASSNAAASSSVSVTSRRCLDNRLMYCHCEHMSTTKEERLQIRVGPADKALLERAAAASHLNVSAFVVQAAATKAEEILAERSSVRLSPQAAIAFTEALERPAEVNDRLVQVLGRKRKFGWLD
jgi:uncharacterized protein (DUF1778 family)